jgi:hypothetical protein
MEWTTGTTPAAASVGRQADRFETLELPTGWTVVDLVAEQVAAPHIAWSRADADLVVAALAQTPGYAALIAWAEQEGTR